MMTEWEICHLSNHCLSSIICDNMFHDALLLLFFLLLLFLIIIRLLYQGYKRMLMISDSEGRLIIFSMPNHILREQRMMMFFARSSTRFLEYPMMSCAILNLMMISNRFLSAECMKTLESHALEVFFLHPARFFNINLLWVELEIGEHRPVIREPTLLDTFQKLLFDLSILITLLLPQNPVAPSRHSLFFARVIVLGAPIILVGWRKINFTLREVTVKLVL